MLRSHLIICFLIICFAVTIMHVPDALTSNTPSHPVLHYCCLSHQPHRHRAHSLIKTWKTIVGKTRKECYASDIIPSFIITPLSFSYCPLANPFVQISARFSLDGTYCRENRFCSRTRLRIW